jgi:hypothetical protein
LQPSLYSPYTDRTENFSYTVACSLVAGKATCPQSCSQVRAVVLSPDYTAVLYVYIYIERERERGKRKRERRKVWREAKTLSVTICSRKSENTHK